MAAGLDIQNGCQTGQSINPQTATASVNGTGIDFADCEAAVTCILNVGDVGAGSSLAVKLQESNDDGDADAYGDITSATMTTVSDASADDNSIEVKTFFNRSKRYVRAVGTMSGSSPDIIYSVTLQAKKTSY